MFNDEKRWQQQSEETKQKPTRKKDGNAKPGNNIMQRGELEERNDQKWKQGGLEKGMARNWLEGK